MSRASNRRILRLTVRRCQFVACFVYFAGKQANNKRGGRESGKCTYHHKLFICSLDMDLHILDVVVNPIQHRSLVDDHGLQVAEDV